LLLHNKNVDRIISGLSEGCKAYLLDGVVKNNL